MRRNKNIQNLSELQEELKFLKLSYEAKGELLKHDAGVYVKQLSPLHLIKKYFTPSNIVKFDEKNHISSKILAVALPFILNKTLLKGSGFLTKAVGTLISGKVGQSLDIDSITGMVNKVKSLFTGKKKDKHDVAFVDYGIPPDSETY